MEKLMESVALPKEAMTGQRGLERVRAEIMGFREVIYHENGLINRACNIRLRSWKPIERRIKYCSRSQIPVNPPIGRSMLDIGN